MTTPARTAEPTPEQVSAYRDYLHYSHPHGRFTYDENAAVLAAVAFVRSCLPEPQASKASEQPAIMGQAPWESKAEYVERVGLEAAAIVLSSAPAGEAVSVAGTVSISRNDAQWAAGACREVAGLRADGYLDKMWLALAARIDASLSAPPPSIGDKPKCPTCGRDDDVHPSADPVGKDGGWFCGRCHPPHCWFPGVTLPAPTPPPAPARGDEDANYWRDQAENIRQAWIANIRELNERLRSAVAAHMDTKAELARLRAAPLSVAPAREGETVVRVDDLVWLLTEFNKSGYRCGHTNQLDRLNEATLAARVTLPQQGEQTQFDPGDEDMVAAARTRAALAQAPRPTT
jgi:hypothetical protein